MHPRRVRHDVPAAPEAGLIVSIHAPAWGATSYQYVAGYVTKFQSTHPRGVRPLVVCSLSSPLGFNPRTRVGCDGSVPSAVCNTSEFQSTHPRGVRRRHLGGICHAQRVSIHAPAWGATRGGQIVFCQWRGFQSTHPRGVRPIDTARKALSAGVSIHAPAWGATPHFVESEVTDRFQSTHPRGVRPALRLHRQGP